MDLYSAALSLALVAVGISVLAASSAWIAVRATKAEARTWLPRLARIGALASLALVTFSLVFHLLTGHRPGTPQAMAVPEFILEHPSFAVVVVLAALVLRWLHRASARSGSEVIRASSLPAERGGPPTSV